MHNGKKRFLELEKHCFGRRSLKQSLMVRLQDQTGPKLGWIFRQRKEMQALAVHSFRQAEKGIWKPYFRTGQFLESSWTRTENGKGKKP